MRAIEAIQRNDPYHSAARSRLRRMDDGQRAEVEAAFVRHQRACRSLGIDPDPAFVPEAVEDVYKGRRIVNNE